MNRTCLIQARRLARRGCFALRPLSAAALLILSAGVQAGGTGELQVLQGAVASTRPNATTQVLNVSTQNAYAQTPTFSVAANETVSINMLSAKSVLALDVTGFDPSLIFGAVQSNGRLFLMNPNGIVFGATARVDVGSLVATTMSLSQDDFSQNRIQLIAKTPGRGELAGVVRNDGSINAPNGIVVLAGHQVINAGDITANHGRVGLAAAHKLLVDVEGDGLLFFEVDGKEAGARLAQLGRIEADGGSVEMMAAARGQFADTVLNMSGVVQARGLGTKQGRVVIDGGDSGVTSVTGTVDVSGLQDGQRGGSVSILGDQVGLFEHASIDASGAAGGGQVQIGGDFQGQGDVRRASQTWVGRDVSIQADATVQGDGGQVVVWADGDTRFLGGISARGGALGGQGGQAEVSGHETLDYRGQVDLRAGLGGAKGTLLLDPRNIEIVATSPDLLGDAGALDLTAASFSANAGGSSTVSKITAGAVVAQLDLANVHLSADKAITVSSVIDASANTGDFGLQLTAGDQIILKADVITRQGLTLDGTLSNGGINLTGAAGPITLNAGAGKLSLGAAVNGGAQNLTLVSTHAGADAIKTAGTITNVVDLTLQGSATLGGDVTTMGQQTYAGTTTLGANVQLDAAASKVSLAAVDGGGHNFTVLTTNASVDAIGTSGTVSSTAVLSLQGNATLGGDVTTTGNQLYADTTTLGATAQLNAGAGKITLAALDGGQHDLTLVSTHAGADAIKTTGAIGNVGALSVQGQATLGGDVTSTGSQTYSSAVTLAAPVKFKGSSLDLSDLAAGTNHVGLRADTITLNGAATGSASVTFEPLSDAGGISVAGGLPAGVGTLALSQALLNKFSTYQNIVVGNAAHAYTIGFGDFVMPTKTLVRSASGDLTFAKLDGAFGLDAQTTGAISLNDLIGGTTALSSVALSGPVTVNTSLVKTSGDQAYVGAVTLANDAVSMDAGAGKISLSSVDGGGAHDLTLQSANAAADAIQTSGAIANVRTLTLQGPVTLGGDVTSTGAQSFSGVTTLANSVTLDAGSAKISLAGVAGGAHDLTIKSSNTDADALKTTAAIGAVSTLSVQAQATLGGDVSTTGAQDYAGAVTLGAGGTVAVTSHGANIRWRDTVDGAQALTINAGAGNVRFDGAVGGATALNSLGVTADSVDLNGGAVNTTGAQTYTANTVTLGHALGTTFTASGLTVSGNLAAGAHDLSVFADALNVTGNISSTGAGQAAIAARQASTTIGVAGGSGTFQVTNAVLNKLANFNTVTVGRADGTGDISFGSTSLNRSLRVRNGAGNIAFGQIDATSNGAFDLDVASASGAVFFNGAVGNASRLRNLTVGGATTIASSLIYTEGAQQYNGALTLNSNAAVIGASVTFGNTVSGASHALAVQSTGGLQKTHFLGATTLLNLAVYGEADVGANITTSQGQYYDGAVSLSDDASFMGLQLTFNSDLSAGTHALGFLTDSFGVNGSLSGTGAAQIASYSAGRNTVVGGAAGGADELVVDATTFSQFSTFSSLTVGRADGTGTVTLGTVGGSFALPANLTLLSGTGDISVLSDISGAHSLALNTSGTTSLNANLSGLTTLSTDAGGTTRIGGAVSTSGAQTYGDAVVLDNSANLAGTTVAFGNTLNAASAGAQGLSINGNARFARAVGASQSLNNLQVLGTAQIDGGGVHTSGSQYYSGASVVGDDSAFTSDGSYVHFNSALTGPHAVTISAVSGTDLMGAVDTASLQVNGGTVFLYGGAVSTTGAQVYAASGVILGVNTALNGTDITLGGTVNGARALAINASGTTTLNGAVGNAGALASLSTLGGTQLNGASVQTTGAQSYGGAVTLGANTAITANTVDFNGTVNGARTLLVNDSGTTTFHGNVGSTTALSSLTTTSGGSTVLPAQVSTTGAQIYGDPVTLSANTTLGAQSVSLSTLLGASHALNMATSGLVNFNGTLTGLSSLDKTGAGTVRFIGANGLSTTGAQRYEGDVQVSSGAATFDGSSLNFNGDISGATNLSLTGDAINVVGGLSGTGTFSIASKSVDTTMGLSGGVGALQVDLNKVSGFAQHVIGRTDGTGAVNVGDSALSAGTTVQSGTGAITFGTLTGARALTVNTAGVTSFGNVSGLTSLTTDAAGSTHVAGGSTLSATTSLNLGDAVVYGGNVSFAAPSLTFGGSVSGGVNLTLSANTLTLAGTLSGSGEVTLQPTAAGTTIGLAGGVGTLQISQATLNQLTGFTSQTIGRADGTGAINADALTLARDTKLQSGAGNVSFGGTVDGAHALVVNTSGITAFAAEVGGATALSGLSTDAGGSTALQASQVRTTGAMSFGDAVTYTGNTILLSDSLQFAAGITGGNDLTLVANALSAGGAMSGSGVLSIRPLSVTSIGLAGAAGDLQLTQALLNQAHGFAQQVIGSDTGAADILSGALTLNGDTILQSGSGQVHFLATVDGAHALTVNTAGVTRFQGDVGASTALTRVTTDAAGSTRIDADVVRTTGAQTYNDPVTANGTLSLVASTVSLHTASNLRLGLVKLALGGDIRTDGVLTLSDSLTLSGGTLALSAGEGPGAGVAFSDPELSSRPGLVTGNMAVKEAAAAIQQTGGTVSSAAGSTLDLSAPNRGSILIDHTTNDIAGDLKAISGPQGDANAARFAGSGTLPLSFVRVDAKQIHAAGIEADVVKLTANTLSTNADTKIRARLPYINAQGIEGSVPALTLVLKQPAVLNQFGTPARNSWIQVDLGGTQGGFLTVRPKGAGAGSSAVFLGGSDANVPFYDGTSKPSEIQVYFNGRVPSTPQEVGALSAVTAVIEESRRARFDEAVRTENVSSRLRTGVIAEVGSGRPATVGSESIRMPASCTPTATLGCQ